MYLNFNNKYFTLAAILLGIYLIHNIQDKRGREIDDFDHTDNVSKATHVFEIDPKKADTDRTFLEKMLYKYAMTKKVEQDIKNTGQVTQYTPPHSSIDVAASLGDQVSINLKELTTDTIQPAPITFVLGTNLLAKSIEEGIVGMKPGDRKVVEETDRNGIKKKFEIELTALFPHDGAK